MSRGDVTDMNFTVFSNRLKSLRKEKHTTQEEMATLLGVTTNHYQKIEYGQINISISVLDTLADYFGVTADYLLGRSDRKEAV